jgi:hypothetical protein
VQFIAFECSGVDHAPAGCLDIDNHVGPAHHRDAIDGSALDGSVVDANRL